MSKLWNEILTKIFTLSHRYGLVILEFKLNLWISRLELCQKCPFSEISGQKIIIWGKFLIKIFQATPLSLLCPYLLPLNYHNSLKYNMKAFQKTCAPRCAKLCFLLKLSLCIQEPFKKYIYVKNWHLWDFGPKFRFFFVSHSNKPPGGPTQNLKSFLL